MKFKFFAACGLSLAMASPAVAQASPDDLHCFLLSNVFAKIEKDEKRKLLAGQATMFYLGKIDGRISPQAFGAAARTPLSPQAAGPLMTACAQRLAQAELALQRTVNSASAKH